MRNSAFSVIDSAIMAKLTKSKPKKAAQKSAAKTKKPAAKAKTTVAKKKAAPKARIQKSSGTRKSPLGKKADIVRRPRSTASRVTQAGDLQGFSRKAEVDSESVDELLEEGNAWEAGIVKGVEDSPYADEGEVRTHEVLEDDVPKEYLDKD